jgi:hypothetical protein
MAAGVVAFVLVGLLVFAAVARWNHALPPIGSTMQGLAAGYRDHPPFRPVLCGFLGAIAWRPLATLLAVGAPLLAVGGVAVATLVRRESFLHTFATIPSPAACAPFSSRRSPSWSSPMARWSG